MWFSLGFEILMEMFGILSNYESLEISNGNDSASNITESVSFRRYRYNMLDVKYRKSIRNSI
jgi:hypothetical protein